MDSLEGSSAPTNEAKSESQSATRHVPIIIEVCVDSVESALAAVRGGADRLEICGNLGLGGGTTPSTGLVRMIKKSCPGHVPLMTMVRPRTGDFVYSEPELSVMLEDIATFARIGVDGVVLGVLTPDASIDVASTTLLAQAASEAGLEVCFHRAFDMVQYQEEALHAVRDIPGITRLLTSGGGPTAPAYLGSVARLAEVLYFYPGRSVSLMPGSGINARNVQEVLRAILPFGVREVHLSGGSWVDNRMHYRRLGMGMGVGEHGEWGVWRTSEKVVREVRRLVDEEWARSGLEA